MSTSDPKICRCCSRRGFLGVTLVSLFAGLNVLADEWHIVRRGETLTALSRKYGITLADLAAANGLSQSAQIQTGQRLKVPVAERTAKGLILSRSFRKSLDRTQLKSGRWRYVVVHHSATNSGTVRGMDRYHYEVRHMEHGLAYHFVIGNGRGMRDGEIVPSRRWNQQLAGGHLASEALNEISLGICLVGNFEVNVPTTKQMQALAGLINYLLPRCRLSHSAVKTHQQINTIFTRCPGRRFPVKALFGMLA